MLIVLQKILGLGAAVVLPIILFLLGSFFRLKPRDALRAGLTVGVGFKGIGLAASLITLTLAPMVVALQKVWNISLDTVDLGVPVVSAMAFSDGTFVLMGFVAIIVTNIVLLLLNWTKTLNVDMWNFWHYLLTGMWILMLTGSYMIALVACIAYSMINLLLADRNEERICAFAGEQYRGLSFTTMAFPFLLFFCAGIDWVIDKIPGVRKINFNLHQLPSSISILGEPLVLGFVLGTLIAFMAQYTWDAAMGVGMTLAAAMFILPRMIGILMEGLSPIADGARQFMMERFPNRTFRIGMDFALLIGDTDIITLGMVMVPVTLFLAVVLPGNRILPLIGLTNLTFMMIAPLMAAKRNMFRAFIIGVINIIVVFYIATDIAPLITKLGAYSGIITDTSKSYSLFNTGEHIGYSIVRIVKLSMGL
ncbi:MAG: system, galactitol-specific component [Firmicutes bacterium]|nr:system, galactitol-specific component [Bacillota bacterium]